MKDPVSVNSVLETKASGCLNVQDDLNKQQEKSIAQLIYEQTEKKSEQSS